MFVAISKNSEKKLFCSKVVNRAGMLCAHQSLCSCSQNNWSPKPQSCAVIKLNIFHLLAIKQLQHSIPVFNSQD